MAAFCKKIFCVVLVVSLLPYVFSIKCWKCDSSGDPLCADPFDNSTIVITDCDFEQERGLALLPKAIPNTCLKIRQEVNGIQSFTRGCNWKRADGSSYSCPSSITADDVTTYCETCDYDSCNGF